jgi:hypothetical protein
MLLTSIRGSTFLVKISVHSIYVALKLYIVFPAICFLVVNTVQLCSLCHIVIYESASVTNVPQRGFFNFCLPSSRGLLDENCWLTQDLKLQRCHVKFSCAPHIDIGDYFNIQIIFEDALKR